MANDNQNKPSETRKPRVEDTIWVLCTCPVTLPMPPADGRGEVPLKLERGLNVLAGHVFDGVGGIRYMTLDGLSADLQQQTPEARGPTVFALFEAAKKLHAPMFQKIGAVPPRVIAVGTMRELSTSEHLGALIAGATNGTHRASLEALTHLPADLVPEHIKELARTRLTAWRPAA